MYLHLCLTNACRTSQGTSIPGFIQQVLLGLIKSVANWCIQTGCLHKQVGGYMAFPSVSVPIFIPIFSFGQKISELKFLCMWVVSSLKLRLCLSAGDSLCWLYVHFLDYFGYTHLYPGKLYIPWNRDFLVATTSSFLFIAICFIQYPEPVNFSLSFNT